MNKTSNAPSACNDYISKTLNKTISSINISNNLTLIEHKFWNYLLFIAQQDISTQVYSTPIKEFNQFIGNIDTRQTHKKIIKIFESLLTKIINFIKETNIQFSKTTYVSSVKLENGILYFEFSQNFKDNLIKINLENNKINPYVSLNLDILNKIKSKHTIALYEYLNSRIFATKEVLVDADYLREILSPNIYYSFFARFNDKVLKHAIKEISENTDLNIVKFETIKGYDNKTVSKIRFIVEKQKISNLSTSNIKDDECLIQDIKIATAGIIEPVKAIAKSVVEKIKSTPKASTKYNFNVNQQELFEELRQYSLGEKLSVEAVTKDLDIAYIIKQEILATKPNILIEGGFGALFCVKWKNKDGYAKKIEVKKTKLEQEIMQKKEQEKIEELVITSLQEQQKISNEQEIKKIQAKEAFEIEIIEGKTQLAQIWSAVHKLVEQDFNDIKINTWFKPAIAKIEADTLNIMLPNRFKLDFFKNNLLRYVNEALHNINVNINVKVSL